jgi:hypothetical protein
LPIRKYLKRRNRVKEMAVRSPHLELAKIVEKVSKRARKVAKRKKTIFIKFSGGKK